MNINNELPWKLKTKNSIQYIYPDKSVYCPVPLVSVATCKVHVSCSHTYSLSLPCLETVLKVTVTTFTTLAFTISVILSGVVFL